MTGHVLILVDDHRCEIPQAGRTQITDFHGVISWNCGNGWPPIHGFSVLTPDGTLIEHDFPIPRNVRAGDILNLTYELAGAVKQSFPPPLPARQVKSEEPKVADPLLPPGVKRIISL